MLDPQRLEEYLVEHGSDDADVIANLLGATVDEVVDAAVELSDRGVTVVWNQVGSNPPKPFISHTSDDEL